MLDIPLQLLHTEADPDKPPRLRRRADRRDIYGILRAAGVPEEEITIFYKAQKASVFYADKMKENRKAKAAGQSPPWSEEELGPVRRGNTMYEKIRKLADDLMSGNPEKIQKVRNLLQQYQASANVDVEHEMALKRAKNPNQRKIVDVLKAAGEPDELLALFDDAQAAAVDLSGKYKQNGKAKAAGLPPPWSEEDLKPLRPGTAMYQRVKGLAQALESGIPERIQKARQLLQTEYEPTAYSDDELRMALTEEEVKWYKELRVSSNAYRRLIEESHKVGQQLRRQSLTPAQRKIDQDRYEYNRLTLIVRRTLEAYPPRRTRLIRQTRMHKDDELKVLLDLVSLGDFVKGRRLHNEYNRRRKNAEKMGVHIRDLPPEIHSKETFDEVVLGNRIYSDALEILHERQEAARRGQKTAAEGGSYRLDDRDKRLFTPEEEVRAKQWLKVPEIEAYVDGKRAERDLAEAQASIETAQREGRKPLVSQKELNDLQDKIAQYRELQRTIDERQAQSLQAQGTKKGTKESPPNDDDAPPPPSPQQQQNPEGVQAQQSSAEEQNQRVPKLLPKPIRPNNPLQFVANPITLTNQVQAGWKQLGNRLQEVPGTITSQVSERANQVGPRIGSLARTRPRVPMPAAGFRAPLPI